DMLVAALDEIDGIHCHRPDGAFYVFASCADLFGLRTPTGRVIRSSDDWIGHLLDSQDLAALQGSAYGVGTHFRLSCASSCEHLREGCRRIARARAQLGP
ncbi:aspartate transaminase, partial [Verminephrobacter sp. Larva24]